MLRRYPMVVGEWSLALGSATWSTCGRLQEPEVQRLFGAAQLRAFQEASHGSFFWNWTEADTAEWNFEEAYRQGLLSGPPPELPHWGGDGEDPLEGILNPSPAEPSVLHGDTVYLRAFHGMYIDVEGGQVNARWSEKGKWQELSIWPPASSLAKALLTARREVHDGDVVRLRTRSGRFLSVDGSAVSALVARGASEVSTEFIVHVKGAANLRHRGIVYLEHCATGLLLDADEEEEGISARWRDRGTWQQFAVEKQPIPGDLLPGTPPEEQVPPGEEEAVNTPATTPPRKRMGSPLAALARQQTTPLTPVDLAETASKRRRRLCGKVPAFGADTADAALAKASRAQ